MMNLLTLDPLRYKGHSFLTGAASHNKGLSASQLLDYLRVESLTSFIDTFM